MKPRLYSDYNGPWGPDFMLLNYNGTLSDLKALDLDLSEGLEVTVYSYSDESEDLESDGVVCFGSIPVSNWDPEWSPLWYVDTRGSKIRYVKREK
jgi:hypothetical protein